MPVVYSTCSSDNQFNVYDKHERVAGVLKSIIIKGGAGVQNKRTLLTPLGAATVVSDEELAVLNEDPHFKTFIENGFMVVDEKAKNPPGDHKVEQVVKDDLTEKDAGAQDTRATYKALNKKGPVEDKE